MKKIHSTLALCCAAFLFVGMQHAMTRANSLQHAVERKIGRLPIESGEPIRIRAVRVKGKKVKRNERIVSDNDWLRTLTITVRNVSHKRIVFASMDLVFPPPPGSGDRIAIDEIDYGNRALLIRPPSADEVQFGVEPNQEIEMQLSAIAYDRIRSLLTEIGNPETQRVNLKVGRIIFADDTSWYGGNFQRDPNDPRGWINSEISSQAKNALELISPEGTTARFRSGNSGPGMSSQSRLRALGDSFQGSQEFPRINELMLPVSYVRALQQSSACYKKAWTGNIVCYWGAQCQTKRELTDMTPGGYQFQSANAMCSDVLGNYCGTGSTTVAIPCSFSGGGGGGGGGGPVGFDNGYEGCTSNWDCDDGYSCDTATGTCQ